MALSASRSEDLLITEGDVKTSIEKTEEVADDLRVVFRAVGESDLVSGSDKVIRILEAKGFASRQEILQFCWRHITSNQLDVILATFREAGMVEERYVGKKTLYVWKDSLKGGNVP
jgi:hypothetical protein